MPCEHKRLRCTNNAFFCLDCGAAVLNRSMQRGRLKDAGRPAMTSHKEE